MAEALSQTPAGCSIARWGPNVVARASLRSAGGFFGSLFIGLFWNGIVSLFVLLALGGLYANLVGPLPAWFPAPEMEPSMSLGMTLFLCIFLIPFVTVGLALVGSLILSTAGKIEVIVGDHGAVVTTGVGFAAWRRRFDPARVRRVSFGTTSWQSNGQPSVVIVIEADRTIKFGSLLKDERREWLHAVLHVLLVKTTSDERDKILSMARRNRRGY